MMIMIIVFIVVLTPHYSKRDLFCCPCYHIPEAIRVNCNEILFRAKLSVLGQRTDCESNCQQMFAEAGIPMLLQLCALERVLKNT